MRALWSERSVRDLEAIFDYISADNPRAARQWVARLHERAETAGDVPLAGRMVPEASNTEIREVFVGS